MSKPFSEETFAESLEHVLVPLQPPDVFRDHLRHGLQLAGNQQRARRGLTRRSRVNWSNWWIGVAAFGASLAAGSLIAYLVRSRLLHSHTS